MVHSASQPVKTGSARMQGYPEMGGCSEPWCTRPACQSRLVAPGCRGLPLPSNGRVLRVLVHPASQSANPASPASQPASKPSKPAGKPARQPGQQASKPACQVNKPQTLGWGAGGRGRSPLDSPPPVRGSRACSGPRAHVFHACFSGF